MIQLYEKLGIKVDERLVIQYLQDDKIAKSFAIYYDLFNKYKSDYEVDRILDGKTRAEIKDRAKAAKFDERLSLIGLLLDGVNTALRAVTELEEATNALLDILKKALGEMTLDKDEPIAIMDKFINAQQMLLEKGKISGTLADEAQKTANQAIAALEEQRKLLAHAPQGSEGKAAIKLIKSDFDKRVTALHKEAEKAGKKLSNLFIFAEEVFGEGQEILVLVTELTMNYHSARFISRFGSSEYFAHNKELLFYERQKELILEIGKLEVEIESPSMPAG